MYRILELTGTVGLVLVCWWQGHRRRNLGYADVAWVASLSGLCLTSLATGPGEPERRLWLGLTVSLWGGRLLYHLLGRLAQAQAEERRYQEFRDWLGPPIGPKSALFYGLQWLLAAGLAWPLAGAGQAGHAMPLTEYLCLLVVLGGLAGEAMADHQLQQFKARQTGPVCDQGLWRYSRHPNYFFEFVVWLGWGLWALVAQGWWLALTAPAVMLWLLTCVTGIPPAERSSLRRCPEAYRRYQQTTSPFVPWRPRCGI